MRAALSLLLLALGLWPLPAIADLPPPLRGVPLSQRFSPDQYEAGPNNTGLAMHSDGRLLVANQDGVLLFDGSDWRLIALPGGRAARDVRRGADGRVYVASIDRFGVIEESAEGELRYRDLRAEFGLDAESGRVGVTGPVLVAADGVWFCTPRELFFYPTGGRAPRRLPIPEDVSSIQAGGDVLYAVRRGHGLVRFRQDAWESIPGGQVLVDHLLLDLLPEPDGWIAVTDRGFVRIDAAGARRVPGDAARLFGESGAMTASRLSDGSLVVGTRVGELQHYDARLQLVERIPVGRARIHALHSDGEGGLWVAMQNGLARVQLPATWTRLGEEHGLSGNLLDIDRHGDALWIAGTSGLLRLAVDRDGVPRAQRQPWVPLEAYAVESAGDALLVGHRRGLLAMVEGAAPRALVEGAAVFHLVRSRHRDDVIYASGLSDAWVLRRRAAGWQVAAHWPLPDLLAHYLVEAAADEVWLSDRRGGPVRLRFDAASDRLIEQRRFGPADGFEGEEESGSHVVWLDGRVHAASGKRSFVLKGERFQVDRHPLSSLIERPMELQVAEAAQGTFALTRRRLLLRARGDTAWTPVSLGEGVRGFVEMRPGSDGVLRLSTWSGQLLQLLPDTGAPRALPPLHIRLDAVELRDEANQRRQRLPIASGEARVPSGSFVVIRPSVLTMDAGAQMRFLIERDVGGWSDWLAVRPIGMPVLPGENRVRIEARSHNGREAVPLTHLIHGEPRWHEMLAVRALAVLSLPALMGGVVMLVLHWRSRRYLAYHQQLERRIGERTRELQEANRRLEELAVEDALTGVANRRALEQGLWREWHRNLDLRRPLAVLMIDVDHFKRINDSLGHAGGDDVLRRVAALLHAAHDPTLELLARYGGEEFALLLPGTPPDAAAARADLLRARIETAGQGVTVSIGVAACVPTASDHPHRLLRRADEALYRAKHAGRNRVEISD